MHFSHDLRWCSTSLQRYQHGSGFVSFKISASPPDAFLNACKRLGIKIPSDVPTGGVWVNGEEMTDRMRLDNALQNNIAMSEESGFWLAG